MTPEITRVLEIDMGHRLLKHEGKCRNAHGHRYRIEVSCRGSEELDHAGRVIDFGAIKAVFGAWLDKYFDHGFIAEEGDPLIAVMAQEHLKHAVINRPPSAENLVKVWFGAACALLVDHGVIVTKMRVYETPNCWADYTMEDAVRDEADDKVSAKGVLS